jgi:hypothetical protein
MKKRFVVPLGKPRPLMCCGFIPGARMVLRVNRHAHAASSAIVPITCPLCGSQTSLRFARCA